LQAKAAVSALGPDAKLPPDAAQAVSRLGFVGQVLGMSVPKDAKVPALPQGADPVKVIVDAEKSFVGAIVGVAKEMSAVGQSLPKDAPKEAVAAVSAVNERVNDAMYAVKFSLRLAPPPAPPEAAQGGTAPAGAPAPSAPPAAAPPKQ
jgi:hypothetical protein